MENVIVVFPKLDDGKKIRSLLVRNGINVDGVCTSGAQTLECVNKLNEGIIVCSYRFTDMYYTQLLHDIPEGFDVLLVASQAHQAERDTASVMQITTPLKIFDLLNTIHMMFEAQARRRKKIKNTPKIRSEEETKTIKEAKNILMERNNMTEAEAHSYLQKCSMDSGTSLVETAGMVICLYRY